MNRYVGYSITWIIICTVCNASGAVFSPLALATPTRTTSTKSKREANSAKQRRICKPLTNHIVCYENVTFVVRHRTNKRIWRYDHNLEVHFVAFNKQFILVLHAERTYHKHNCKSHIFHRNMTVTVIGETGRRIVNYSFEHNFCGYLDDEPTSSIFQGTYTGGVLDGVIYTPVETYYVDPSGNYFNVANRSNKHTAVIYRETDLNWSKTKSVSTGVGMQAGDHDCWGQQNQARGQNSRHFTKFARNNENNSFARWRSRRQKISPMYRVCELTVVVDHSFYKIRCGGSVLKTVSFVMFAVKLADHSFRRVDFGSDDVGTNIGFVIREMVIYTNDTSPNYRLGKSNDSYAVLMALTTYNFNRSCLGVLFTHRKFDKSIIGLTYTGCTSPGVCVGGMCQKRLRHGKVWNSYNVLLVSSLKGDRQFSRRAVARSLTHELGHAFGAPHDSKAECMLGGKYGVYLMHPSESSARKPNSFTFSPCSIKAMRPLVRTKGSCLKVYAQDKYCGNFIREHGEECDCGPDTERCVAFDKCCEPPSDGQPGCRIARQRGYVCSPRVSLCCTEDCRVETGKRECRAETECAHAVDCSSTSTECPLAVPLPDGKPCDGGVRVCSRGQCSVSRCVANGWFDCLCYGIRDELCQLCCSSGNSTQSVCKPAFKLSDADNLRKPIYRNVADPCKKRSGFCNEKHVCVIAYPRGVDDLIGVAWRSFWDELCVLLAEHWLVILLALALLLLLLLLLSMCCRKDDTLRASSYRTGRNKAHMMLWSDYLALAEQLRRLELDYENELRRLDEDHPVDFVVAIARLRMMFPTAPRTHIFKAARHSNCEEFAVRRLLLLGHPMKVWQETIPEDATEKQKDIKSEVAPEHQEGMSVTAAYL